MHSISDAETNALHDQCIVIDTHCDTLLEVVDGKRRLGDLASEGQFDLHRARQGGLTAEIMAVYLRSPRAGTCTRQTLQYIDALHTEVDAFSDLALLATQVDDILRAKELEKTALLLSLEGAEGLEGDLSVLRSFYRLGLRAMGLTWNWRNEAADGVGEIRTGGGLSEFGVKLVKECNRLGILIDMAHLSPAGVRDVLEISEAPVVVTHANCDALWPHRRNLTDAQLEAVSLKGGVVGVTPVPSFLGPDAMHGQLDTMLDHVDHMVKVMGEDGVGLGTDFDGMHAARTAGLEDVAELPKLTKRLAERGYSPASIRKILGGNFLRVFEQVLP